LPGDEASSFFRMKKAKQTTEMWCHDCHLPI
jgi:hypothetical protein